MLSKRIIPCLDVRGGRVVKCVRFRDHVDMGDITPLALQYRDQGADELVFYDIGASPGGRAVDCDWVERVSALLDIPFCVAGGIRDVATARAVLHAGADVQEGEVGDGEQAHVGEGGEVDDLQGGVAGGDADDGEDRCYRIAYQNA